MNVRRKILMGKDYFVSVPLDQYGGAVFKVHAVPDMELTNIEEEAGYTLVDVLQSMSDLGLTKAEIEALKSSKASPEIIQKLMPMLQPKTKRFLAALCKAALLPDDPDPDCPECKGNPEYRKEGTICQCRDLVSLLHEFRGLSLLILGLAALGATLVDYKEVESFFSKPKAPSGHA